MLPSMPSSSFQSQQPLNTQISEKPVHVSLQRDNVPRSMMPGYGESIRPPDAPGRTPDFLTPGGYSEQGVIDFRNGQSVYRTELSHPGTGAPSSSYTVRPLAPPSLSPFLSSNISHLAPPVSAAFPRQPMSYHVPDTGSLPNTFNFTILDHTFVAFDPNYAGPPQAWEQDHQAVLVPSREALPIGIQTLNYSNDRPMGDASPLGPFPLSFGDNSEWQTPANTSPSYSLSTYSTSSPSTSSHGYIDTFYYPGLDQQGPNGV